jgi:hypothetical protein
MSQKRVGATSGRVASGAGNRQFAMQAGQVPTCEPLMDAAAQRRLIED